MVESGMVPGIRCGCAAALALLLLSPVTAAAQDQTVTCGKCHADSHFIAGQGLAPDRAAAVQVSDSTISGSVHAGLACQDCHDGFASGYPHRGSETTRGCETCHESEGAQWAGSIHAWNAAVLGDSPTCVRCHGTHDIGDVTDRDSPIHPFNVANLCGSCHGDPEIMDTYFPEGSQGRSAVEQYHETVHGFNRAGLTLSATCNDCHSSHGVLPGDSAGSMVNPANIAATCGQCHAGVVELFLGDEAHNPNYSRRHPGPEQHRFPTCIDCHSTHSIVRSDEPGWFIGLVEECGECHERVYQTYFKTYHGEVTQLGFGLTAKCSDCHTAHQVLPASDLASSVSPVNIVATCQRCHPDANENFARYMAHGDPRDRVGYPKLFWPWAFMTSLLVSVWSFFGVHSLLWFNGLAIERRRARKARAGERRA